MHSPPPNLSSLVAPSGRQKKYELDGTRKKETNVKSRTGPQAPNFYFCAVISNILAPSGKQRTTKINDLSPN
jgi:hypothetical protein